MSLGRLTKAKINELIIYQIIGFYTAKEISNKMKRQASECDNIFAYHMLGKGLTPRVSIYKLICSCCLVSKSHPTLLGPHGL